MLSSYVPLNDRRPEVRLVESVVVAELVVEGGHEPLQRMASEHEFHVVLHGLLLLLGIGVEVDDRRVVAMNKTARNGFQIGRLHQSLKDHHEVLDGCAASLRVNRADEDDGKLIMESLFYTFYYFIIFIFIQKSSFKSHSFLIHKL